MTPKILVVEDEPTIALGLEDDLTIEGFQVEVAADGVTAAAKARSQAYDLLLLDIMLPKKDGLTVCRELRGEGVKTPIILLTARSQELDKVLGLELGADDYVTKPFSPRELVARIRAVLRRAEPARPPDVLRIADLHIDFARFEARRGSRQLDLTPLEFRLLRAFVSAGGQVVTHDRLIADVWGPDVFLSDRVIYTHINNLRRKIEVDPSSPALIVGVRGVGYKFGG
jgi:two-component system alkaline phosphatase synthesis response regulator PhoP